MLTSTLFYRDVTIHGFTFYTEDDGTITENPWYYKQAEVNEKGQHPEDVAWKRQSTNEFLSSTATKERKDMVNKLVEQSKIKWLN